MKSSVQSWTSQIVEEDGEYYLLLPEGLLDQLGWEEDQEVNIEVQDGKLLISKVEKH